MNEPPGNDPSAILGANPPSLEPEPSRRRHWGGMAAILASYPLALGGLGAWQQRAGDQPPMLPTDLGPLMTTIGVELGGFGVLFFAAWLMARPNASALYLNRGKVWAMMGRAFLFSIGLRVLVAMVGLFIIAVMAIAQGGSADVEDFRAHTEVLVNSRALVENPLYLWMSLTVISFVLAGLREELWRAGMFAALLGMRPEWKDSLVGQTRMILVVALIFGLGHLPQGWGGVIMTGVLGAGLGGIIVWRKSLWEACLAHGFFNAATFAFLYYLARFHADLVPGAQ